MALFDETTPISEVTVDTLVGDGKKFKTTDDLARAKAESDRVIQARERELAELREELSKRETTEELLQRLQAQRPNQSAEPIQEGTPPSKEAPSLTDEDLERRIEALTTKKNKERTTAENVNLVTNRLIQEFGTEDKANEVVNNKARELGVSTAFLQEVAAASPKAFFAQLGLTEAPKSTPSVPRSDVNTAMIDHRQGAKPGTYSYYENLRNTLKPEEYFSPKVQNQMMKDAFAAAERGEDFFKT